MKNENQEDQEIGKHIKMAAKNRHATNIEELIELLCQENEYSREEIVTSIKALQARGDLTLNHEGFLPTPSLEKYLTSSRSYWYWAVIVLSLATVLFVFAPSETAFPLIYINYLLGSIFVLGLPGFSFVKALFPAKELTSIALLAYSVAMSLVLVSISGLLLSYTPWGIQSFSVTFTLFILITLFSTVAVIREKNSFDRTRQFDNWRKP